MSFNSPYNQIVIIDDTDVDLFISKKIIEAAKFANTVLTYKTGKDALQELESRTKQQIDWPELFFIDIRMPEMDGFEFIEKIEALVPKSNPPKFILYSTEITDEIRQSAGKNKLIHKVLRKPFTVEDLRGLAS
ncbi:MAG: response regulator [Bacteroidetes bacterium]|nr:response regulator [Bacteroidota bacterium]MBL0066845.1 response regulator [Bacteroidota bacterium]MBL0140249.1 response regulator [Bacteroidota bacterium]